MVDQVEVVNREEVWMVVWMVEVVNKVVGGKVVWKGV
jgi:hypothetical protein